MIASDTVGFAILGAGIVADTHKQAIAANVSAGARLVAVGHYNRERFPQISAKFGVPCLGQQELLAHPAVDVVCICTPSGQHAAQVIAAARAGKHVLVEKPMALSLADADAMIAACHRAGVKLGVAFQWRALSLFQRIYRAIQAGDLGDLTLGTVAMPYYRSQAYYDQAGWRGTWALDGGGVLMNQGIHLVDLLVWYMGDPAAVQAHAGTLHRVIEVEDTLTATLRFSNGALATIAATTTAAPGFLHRLEIYGTKGGVQVKGDTLGKWRLADRARETIELSGAAAPACAGAGSNGPAGHTGILGDFIRALRQDRAPLIDGAEGRRSLMAVLKIYKAAGLLEPIHV